MCGICGIHGIETKESAILSLKKMNEALAHRGPDAEGEYIDEIVALGHRRLSIIDLSEDSNQPMSDNSGRYTLVFNGEIYNYKELRNAYSSYDYITNSDSEVLLAGLIKWGVSFLKNCNGMFAFAFWDSLSKELILGRDRMGIKPLYYARNSSQTLFASEIRAIMKCGLFDIKLNGDVLGEFLRYQTVHGSNTLVKGIYMVPPGSVLSISDNEYKIQSFWSPTSQIERGVQSLPYSKITQLIRNRLSQSVSRRLISDVPIGAFLSGGIDSSGLVALAAQERTNPLKTFNISFEEGEFSEAPFAKLVAEKYNTDHTQIDLSPSILLDTLPLAINALDHPSGDGINSYVVSKAAKDAGITVALSGLGGDELFAGYPIFEQFYSLQDKGWLMSFPKFVRSIFGNFLLVARPGIASEKIKQVITEDYLDLEYVYQYSREVASNRTIQQFLNNRISGSDAVFKLVQEHMAFGTDGYSLPKLSRVSYAEIITYLQSVLLRDTDQMSMAHALEIRVPFLDHELVNTVLSVPDIHKYPSSPKKLLVDSLGDLIPPEISNRKKMGFTFPWSIWMKNELKEFCGDLLLDLSKRPEFSQETILNKWDGFLKDDNRIPWSRIWYLCILQAWISRNDIR